MPLLWGKTRCKEATGWEERIAAKLGIAGTVGAAVGSVLSVLQQRPLVSFTAASSASFLMLAGCFSVVQETSRLVRCRDSPLNSVLAGAATGALLFKSHGRAGAPGAIVCAALGGAAHLASAKVEAAGGLQRLLISMDLLDPPPEDEDAEQQQQGQLAAMQLDGASAAVGPAPGRQSGGVAAGAPQQPAAPEARPWWHRYSPIKKMSDEEWQAYKARQDEAELNRIEAALAGGLPVMVDRPGQEQGQGQDDAAPPQTGASGQ